MIRHYNITVKGKVQRVSYRFCTHAQALKCNLTGYVKNLHNGDVFIEAEGNEDDINKLIEWCYVGSPLSNVKEVIAEEGDVKNFETFEVKK
ncbi:MAG: acyP [Bacteroidetes bacterium]|nr:acyP [Bacteroidota bacterium]MDF2450821.1 acyP [Bacteroidota bacterium]